jgi:hypothetical protein
MTNCILCDRPLSETTAKNLLLHEEAEDCLVRVTDGYGVSIDEDYGVEGDDVFFKHPVEEVAENVYASTWLPVDEALKQIFAGAGLERLGGRSTGSGWSNVSLFQKCPYAWKRSYLSRDKGEGAFFAGEPVPLAVGSLIHTYLAVYYQKMITPSYPLTADDVNQAVITLGCNPEATQESWRLFTAYRLFYKNERVEPLAVEANFVDPRTGHSCRYDLVAYFPDEAIGRLSGTYNVEHKTASRFDQNTLEGWAGDGEILGQIDIWQRLKLERRFGPLRGVLVNLIGKQKVPQFHRTVAAPTAFAIDQHRQGLRTWNASIQVAKATGVFPRARANCIHRFGRCQWWDHCNLGED